LRLLIELEGLRQWMDGSDRVAAQALQERTEHEVRALEHDTRPATVEAAMQADWALHAMFVGALRSTLLADIYRQNRERQRLIGRIHRMHPAKVARSALLEHLDVLAAMAEGDRTRAAQALEAHLNAAMRRQIGL
jgi:DNA-binding GntR family transcriptional regulator